MVATATLLPDEAQFRRLAALRGTVTVLRDDSERLLPDCLLLDAHSQAMLAVAWEEVVFKFDIFGLAVKSRPTDLPPAWRPMATIREPAISCLFRCEWERPALPGEVRPDWEQIAAGHGPRTAIPDVATAVGVSMIGLLIAGEERSLLAMADTDAPTTFAVAADQDSISAAVATCECVHLRDAPRFVADVAAWMSTRFRN